MPTLLSPRLKLERAGEHIKTLHTEFQAYMDRDPHSLSTEVDAEGWNVVSIEIVRPMPEQLALIAGDAIHCIRSSLDHIVYAVATGSATKRRGCYWPVAMTEAEYLQPRGKAPCERPSMREEGLRAVPEPIRAIVDSTQPYHGGSRAKDHVFAVISRLDNADKHRVVPPALAVVKDFGEVDASLVAPGPARTLHEEWIEFGRPLVLNEKTKLLRWRTDPPTPADQVNVKFKPTMNVVFGEVGTFDQVWKAFVEIKKLVHRIEAAIV